VIELFKASRHWVFDLDGTLTKAVHDFDHIRRELDIPPAEDILTHIHRLTADEKHQKTERLNELEHFYAQQAQPAEGVELLIRHLHKRSCHLAILTRNTRPFALMSLESIGLLSFFDEACVLGRDEAPPKPDPAGIHCIKEHWGVNADSHTPVVMVGDYRFDLAAGKSAQCLTIHVHEDDQLQWPDLTDYRAKTLVDIHDYLRQ